MGLRYDPVTQRLVNDAVQTDNSHFKNWFPDPATLQANCPAGVNGDYALVGSTKTLWLWHDTAWINSTNISNVIKLEYSVDGLNAWHSDFVAADFFFRYSLDNGESWSIATRFVGPQGAPGADAPHLQLEYSVDGAAAWHTDFTDGDLFLRTSTDGGNTWGGAILFVKQGPQGPAGQDGQDGQDGAPGQDGPPGADAPHLQIEYSVNGADAWHTDFTDGDLFLRTSTDGGNTWGAAIRFRSPGEDSAPIVLGTSGNQTIDGGKNYTLTPASAVTLVTGDFTDIEPSIIKITNGYQKVSFPASWIWLNPTIPTLQYDGSDVIHVRAVVHGATTAIIAERIEKYAVPVETSYDNPGGTGDRTGIISCVDAIWPRNGETGASHINGDTTTARAYQNNTPVTGMYTIFDFGTAKIVTEARWYAYPGDSSGYWNFRGSNDGIVWSEPLCEQDVLLVPGAIFDMSGNNVPYRYLKRYGASGTSGTQYWCEIEFKIN